MKAKKIQLKRVLQYVPFDFKNWYRYRYHVEYLLLRVQFVDSYVGWTRKKGARTRATTTKTDQTRNWCLLAFGFHLDKCHRINVDQQSNFRHKTNKQQQKYLDSILFDIQVLVHILWSNDFSPSYFFFFSTSSLLFAQFKLFCILYECLLMTKRAFELPITEHCFENKHILVFSMMGRREYLEIFQSNVMFKQNQIEWTKKNWFKYRFRLGFWRSWYRILSVIKCLNRKLFQSWNDISKGNSINFFLFHFSCLLSICYMYLLLASARIYCRLLVFPLKISYPQNWHTWDFNFLWTATLFQEQIFSFEKTLLFFSVDTISVYFFLCGPSFLGDRAKVSFPFK